MAYPTLLNPYIKLIRIFIIVSIVSYLGIQTATAETRFASGDTQVHLIELYTSEGCNSCPPADRWLSQLKNSPALFSEVIPAAFHVDYWNYLGWQDKYSQAEFSNRQRHYFQQKNISGVYTPGMFLDGFEWTQWRSSEKNRFQKNNAMKGNNIGNLVLTYNNKLIDFEFHPHSESNLNNDTQLSAYVALLGADINSPIAAGENRGKTLQHDFVVLAMDKKTMTKQQDYFVANLTLSEPTMTAPRFAIAAWVSTKDNLAPLQAAGGWLP